MTHRHVYWIALLAGSLVIAWRFDLDQANFWIAQLVLWLGCVAGYADARGKATP